MKSVKVALIGAGSLATRMHYPSLASFEDVEIVGICDLDRDRLDSAAGAFGIRNTFKDYKEMLSKTSPDAVYAIMPPHFLFEIAMDVLESGCNLFVEKPPAITTFQTESLARAAQRKGLVTGVGFQRRYHPMVIRCYNEVAKHGAIHQVNASFFKLSQPQEIHPYYRGSVDILHCDAIHALDAVRFYAGLSAVETVKADVRTLDCWYHVSYNALIRFENGVTGVFQTNWRTGRRFFRFEFHGYGASAYADIDEEGTVYKDESLSMRTKPDTEAGSDEAFINQGFQAESRAFIDAVKAGSQVHNSLGDAVLTMRLADQILADGADGR